MLDKKLLEQLPHSIDALAFLLQVGVNVEVEGGADVGVAEEDADGLVVAFAFDAAGGKTMPETVEAHFGKAKLLLEFVEVAAICAGLRWRSGVGEDVEVSTDNLFQRADQGQQVARHRDLPDGVLGLGFVHDKLRIFLFSVHQVDALDGLVDADNT